MKKFSERIRGTREANELTQQQLADKSGVSIRTIQNWETGAGRDPQPVKLGKVAKILNVSIPYLMGDDSAFQDHSPPSKGNAQIVPNVSASPSRRIPVISWAAAGRGGNYTDMETQIEEYIEAECADPNAYALIIEGDSMMPRFEPGERAIFLPNEEPRNGDIVVARLVETGQVFFKLYHTTGKKNEIVRLTSYNPAYPVLEYPRSAFRFIHPAYRSYKSLRG
jgi:phage repressor protein C with HTH and peptisase S24 domain